MRELLQPDEPDRVLGEAERRPVENAQTRALFREYFRRRRARIAATRADWSVAVRSARSALERLTIAGVDSDQVKLPMFVAGDRCGTCGADLDITAPDKATCPRCGPDAVPW